MLYICFSNISYNINMKFNFKDAKGITVISLIITIIAMIIIAAISIRAGLTSINSTQDGIIESSLTTVQQAISQKYIEAKTLNNINKATNTVSDTDFIESKPNSFIGTPLTSEAVNNLLQKHKNGEDELNLINKENANQTYDNIYYHLTDIDLEKLGITEAKGQEYIVNYATGEVWDITNVTYESGEFAYINGFSTTLDVTSESFVDSPINITLYEDLKKVDEGKYKFSIKVTDEIAKITPNENVSGSSEKQKAANDPDDLNILDILNDNQNLIVEIDGTPVPSNKINEIITIEKNKKVDTNSAIGEHYVYDIILNIPDDTNSEHTVSLVVKPDAIVDDEGNINSITEIATTSKDSVDIDGIQFDFSLGNIQYNKRNEEGELSEGITVAGDLWGSSASIDLTLTTDDTKGLNREEYEFYYLWSTDTNENNLNWADAKKVTLSTRQGTSTAKATIYLDGDTGKGQVYVKPAKEYSTASGRNMDTNNVKSLALNLDSTPPEYILEYKNENNEWRPLEEYLSSEKPYFRFDPYTELAGYAVDGVIIEPNIRLNVTDQHVGLEVDDLKDENPHSYFSYGVFEDFEEDKENIKQQTEIAKRMFYSVAMDAGILPVEVKDGYPRTVKSTLVFLKGGQYGYQSGEFGLVISKDWTYDGAYIKDALGNMIFGEKLYNNLKIDYFKPELSEITVYDDGHAEIKITEDYSGINLDYSKIKYAWIKENTVPDNVQWKSATQEQVKQILKDSDENIKEVIMNLGKPSDLDEYYLAVKLDGLEDFAGNKNACVKVSSDTLKVDVVEYNIENLQINAETENGPTTEGIQINDEVWGKSAMFEISVSSTGKKGLKAGNYIFEYAWSTEKDFNWDTSDIKSVTLNVPFDGKETASTSSIIVDSYSGKGYLHVRPTEIFTSVSGEQVDSAPKSIELNLDNDSPNFSVKYQKENGVYENMETVLGNEEFYLTLNESNSSNSLASMNPSIMVTLEDTTSGVNDKANLKYAFAEREQVDEYIRLYGKDELNDMMEYQSAKGTIKKDSSGYPVVLESVVEISENSISQSGEYYFIVLDSSDNTGKTDIKDNVGNKIKESKIVGPVKIDLTAPIVENIVTAEDGTAEVVIIDDYSGLSNDYSKIKYAWVENKTTEVTKWETVTSEQVTVESTNEYDKTDKIKINIDVPLSPKDHYLAVKFEGYEDIAGNSANTDAVYSEDSYGLAKELEIEIFEDDEITYPKSVNIKIKSKSGQAFKLESISYEHVGLNDLQPIEGINVDITDEFIVSYNTTVNGPIRVIVKDCFEEIHEKTYTVKNVQATELVLDLDSSKDDTVVLPLSDSKKQLSSLLYIDWDIDDQNEGEYINKPTFSVVYGLNKEGENSPIHTYDAGYKNEVVISISGETNYVWQSQPDYYNVFISDITEADGEYIRGLVENTKNKITEIKQFGIHSSSTSSISLDKDYYYFENLKKIPMVDYKDINKNAFKNVTTIRRMFGNTALEEVPEWLFEKGENITDFSYIFTNTNLTNVPAGLFKNCTSAIYFDGVFSDTKLKTIPKDLFSKNKNATDFSSCFSQTLISEIPKELFKENNKATKFDFCFYNTPLTQIPEDLFKSNIEACYFESCFSKTQIKEIPAKLFETNKEASDFESCFSYTLIEEIPYELFSQNVNASNFENCFCGSKLKKLQNETDAFGIFDKNLKASNFTGCFWGTLIEEIPPKLFAQNKNASDFERCFSNTLIKEIPSELFAKNKKATNFSYCFSNTPIKEIPSNLFEFNTNVWYFNSCFAHTDITSIPPNLFSTNVNVSDFSRCFEGSEIKEIPSNLFKNNVDAYKFIATFAETLITEIPDGLFSNVGTEVDNNNEVSFDRTGMTFEECFDSCYNLTKVDKGFWGDLNVKNIKDVNEMFGNCINLIEVGDLFNGFSKISSLEGIFYGCSNLKSVDPDIFKGCINVTSLGGLFCNCINLNKIDSQIFKDMESNLIRLNYIDKKSTQREYFGVFQGCSNLEQCPKLWDFAQWKDSSGSEETYNAFYNVSNKIKNQIPDGDLKKCWTTNHMVVE